MANLKGETPKTFAITAVMEAVRDRITMIDEDELVDDDDALTKYQRAAIYKEMAMIYNRLGEQWQRLQPRGNWSPLRTSAPLNKLETPIE